MFEAKHGGGAVDNNLMATGGRVSTYLPNNSTYSG